MSWLRHAKKTDKTQPGIVKDLRACGYMVYEIGLPVDLLIRHPGWPSNHWALLEAKSKEPNGKHYVRAAMKTQSSFCAAHGVPYVFDTEQALAYLKERG